MPLITLDMVVGSIVELGVQSPLEWGWNKAKRTETVIKLLKKLNIPTEPDRDDFDAIYRFALVEWGLHKPAPLLNFFRNPDVADAFAHHFRSHDLARWQRETAAAYEAYLANSEVETDPRRQLEAFVAVFNVIVDRTDTAAGSRRDQRIAQLHAKLDVILQLYHELPSEQNLAEKLEPYLKMVARRTNHLPLGPLDPKGRDSTQLSLASVFISLYAEAMHEVAIFSEAGQQKYRHKITQAALAHMHRQQRLILLGDPGSGKSTLLRYLAFCLAQAAQRSEGEWLEKLGWVQEEVLSDESELDKVWSDVSKRQISVFRFEEKKGTVTEVEQHWQHDGLIPVMIELRDFAQTSFDKSSPTAIWDFVAQRLRQEDLGEAVAALRWQAQRGKVMFLLDGVDEVPAAKRASVWQAVVALQEGVYGDNRWVTTCRILSYDADEVPIAMPVQRLQSLTPQQSQAFVKNWYDALADLGEVGREEAAVKSESLQRAIQGAKLAELAAKPILLTIMAIVQTHYGTLPDERAKLYQQCVETLLLRWQRHKELDGVTELPNVLAQLETTQERLERLLWEIAWEAHSGAAERKEAADIPEATVMAIAKRHLGNYAKAEQFVIYTEQRAHLLIGRGGQESRNFAFPHRTFQEYLAACHLAFRRRLGRRAAELAAAGDTWREVLNLAAGTLVFNGKSPDKVLDAVEDMLPRRVPEFEDEAGWRQIWLAAEMVLVLDLDFVRADEVGSEVLPRLQALLAALLTKGALSPPQRAAAGVALGWLGDGRPDVACGVPEMVPVAAGAFWLGSDKNMDDLAYDDEEPQHSLTLPAYRIGKYPVTVAQFGRFVAAGGYTERWHHCWTAAGWQRKEAGGWTEPRFWQDKQWAVPNHPVVGVSWYEAVAYCNWLSETTGRSFRLPDEAMWEKAARGTEGWIYPWGNEWDSSRLNASETQIGQTTAVGLFPTGCSPYGAYDMVGNVWEWCSGAGVDETPYPFEQKSYNDDLVVEATARSLRGGAFHNYGYQYCRAAYRNDHFPHYWGNDIGFRVAEHLSDPDC